MTIWSICWLQEKCLWLGIVAALGWTSPIKPMISCTSVHNKYQLVYIPNQLEIYNDIPWANYHHPLTWKMRPCLGWFLWTTISVREKSMDSSNQASCSRFQTVWYSFMFICCAILGGSNWEYMGIWYILKHLKTTSYPDVIYRKYINKWEDVIYVYECDKPVDGMGSFTSWLLTLRHCDSRSDRSSQRRPGRKTIHGPAWTKGNS